MRILNCLRKDKKKLKVILGKNKLPLEKKLVFKEYFIRSKKFIRVFEDFIDNKEYDLKKVENVLNEDNKDFFKKKEVEVLNSQILHLDFDNNLLQINVNDNAKKI